RMTALLRNARRCALLALLSFPLLSDARGQSKVVLENIDGKHRLLRDGKPYFIKGVGGDTRLDQLAALGGNSIRTWGTDNLKSILDEAHRRQLTVCVGFWMGHERHGFNYQNETAVVKQLKQCLDAVREFKDHPAVLMWAVGNEMEGEGTNPAVWYAVDLVARECKRIDPNHPTMTVIAELGKSKVESIERFCPNIDVIGVNSYGGLTSLAPRYRKAGGTKPYIVTEFGPLGPWEVGKTAWKSPLETSSTVKGKRYADSYRKSIAGEPGLCLGSYAFLWGQKQETTATWFGMLLSDGSRLAAADAMSEAWTGTPPENRCPRIDSLSLSKTRGLKPGEKVEIKLETNDPEGDALSIQWVLRHDSATIGVGGDFQIEETSVDPNVKTKNKSDQGAEAVLTVPKGGGGYRLFAYVRDGQGGAAVANVPLHVDAPVLLVKAPKGKLPLTIYADDAKPSPYAPSGFMGNTGAVKMTFGHLENPRSGKTCLKVEYQAGDDWGGVVWQSPANDWGNKPGGLNLTGAGELEFWVRGAKGGEVVSFVMGVIGADAKYRDSSKAELKEIRLTKEWRQLRIPLDGRDLSRIKTGFGWSLAGQGDPVTFYLDDIRYVAP
ncbi:MAG: hypothetical protein N2C14_12190, partial [Planctomycetales bacterium]